MNTRQHLVRRWQSFKDSVRKWWGRSRAELKTVDMERYFWPLWMP
jgi:hypothetical protein